MQSKLYVGNLPFNMSESDLEKLFAPYGTIQSVNLIRDGYTGRSKGFAFVEMASAAEAEKALEQNGAEVMGRKLTVNEARPQKPREGGRSGERKGGFGGGRRYMDNPREDRSRWLR